ncbi:Zn-dependent protease with chaperone function [Stackebrandtia endophytica]|uniref:Zn-dependent protease with chaperone function n=1 Tax=Stackebrandtia endophytica TaxID=1496996 RepID=A0A543AYG4_9ACTN|nr:M48 family metallopeptidase [Stackebrandtia endophytica]TQL77560.1 Zn-dependent protease with chaperone function [Stackebrandtia endophytica]
MTRPDREPVILRGISSRAWEHPADRGALVALRELRGFDVIVRKLASLMSERQLRLQFLGGAIRVDRHQYASVYQSYLKVAATLDVTELPELYVSRNPDLGGLTIGIDRPIVSITSGSVQMLDEEELRFLLAHELGHAVSGHALYRTMLKWVLMLTSGLSWLPVGSVGLRVIAAALMEWQRKSELTADRAGLLAVQDPAVATRLLARIAGGGDLSQIDIAAFLQQAKDYESGGDLRDSFLKLMMLESLSHDVPVERAAALHHWVNDGEYQAILGGDFPMRSDDDSVSISAEAKAAARHYKEAFNRSSDPLASMVRRLRDKVAPGSSPE